MPVKNAGENFDLDDDNRILEINAPREKIQGRTHVVVHKNKKERWVIIALEYEGDGPCLGMRWFWNKSGLPNSRQYATWRILPKSMSEAILQGGAALKLSPAKIGLLENFIAGKITGTDLKSKWNRKQA